MGRHPDKTTLQQYLANDLWVVRRIWIAWHLRFCAECREALQQERKALAQQRYFCEKVLQINKLEKELQGQRFDMDKNRPS